MLARILVVAVLVLGTTATARADSATTVAVGGGAYAFTDEGITEPFVPFTVRVRSGAVAYDVGRDSLPFGDPALTALGGIYRAGVRYYPAPPGDVQPYGVARLGFLLAGAHDDKPHVWNVGLHYALGAGVEWTPSWVGLWAELGLFGDVGGAFVVPGASAGVVVTL